MKLDDLMKAVGRRLAGLTGARRVEVQTLADLRTVLSVRKAMIAITGDTEAYGAILPRSARTCQLR